MVQARIRVVEQINLGRSLIRSQSLRLTKLSLVFQPLGAQQLTHSFLLDSLL
jgi:hypothetical protein